MKNERLLEALGQIDENFIVEAAPQKRQKKKIVTEYTWKKLKIVAVCACAIVVFCIPSMLLIVDEFKYRGFWKPMSGNANTDGLDYETMTNDTMDMELKVELTLEEAALNNEFGLLFPTKILEGYVLDGSVMIYEESILVAEFYNETLEEQLIIRIASEKWFREQYGNLELNKVMYHESQNDQSSFIYIDGGKYIVQYIFSKTDIAKNENFYDMVNSAAQFNGEAENSEMEKSE